jgi:hypothetical protein
VSNPAKEARNKLKQQAKAIRFRGENRGWTFKRSGSWRLDEETKIGGIFTWQFVKGGKFQPLPEKA